MEGSDVSIRCNIRGFPRPEIEFRLNGTAIIPGMGKFKNYMLEFYDQVSTNCNEQRYGQTDVTSA